MRLRKVSIRLALPIVLIALVALLATLQYRWLGQVSEAERAQLQRSLTQSARDLADDFDREITQAYLAHQVSRAAVESRNWRDYAAAIDRWRITAKFPQMVRAFYLAELDGEQYVLHRFNDHARTFDVTATSPWPAHLDIVRKQLHFLSPAAGSAVFGKAKVVSISLTPALPDAPALLIPVAPAGPFIAGVIGHSDSPAGGTTPDVQMRTTTVWTQSSGSATRNPSALLQAIGSYVVVDLDGEYLKTTMLPALVARHFPEAGADAYRIAVLSSAGSTIFARGTPRDEPRTSSGGGVDLHWDVSQAVFAVRLDLVRSATPGANSLVLQDPGSSVGPGPHNPVVVPRDNARMSIYVEQRASPTMEFRGVSNAPRAPLAGWRLVLQHPSGSLDAAVAGVRLRNLWLSFGILAVLAVGVLVVVVNARRAEQLAARQMDFVATVSHELRTPLAVIRSAAQNLSAGVVAEADQTKRYGDLIDGEGRRLTDMIEQVLTFAGLESGRRLQATKAVDVRSLVDDEVVACKPLCDAAGITIEVDPGNENVPPTVKADEVALRRALHNLLANAAKHGADGRWIGVKISSSMAKKGREVQIEVSDRGRGIDPADLPHVFEPFHRGRYAMEQQINGSGLGLSLVKRIVEAHGGRVSVKSTPGHGATFTLHLPTSDVVFTEISFS